MRCSSCQFENPAGMRFCVQCGAPIAQRCPACGTEVAVTFRFCGQCGASLQPTPGASPASAAARAATYTPRHLADKILKSRSALEGERRQVTVLFADVAGFTSLSERLDPEEVHAIMDRCFEAITAEVHRLDGTINQYTGDGVMALFGAPIAHEDGPRRAAHAALGIQRAIRDLSRDLQAERGLALQMRIGLNTGPVVVGRIGDDLRMDYTALGDTTNLAARLQQAARPGSVLVSEATHRAIVGFFEALDLGEQPVKGHAPVRAFEVLRARGRRARLDVAAERGLTPLVGRGRELRTLLDVFAKVRAGHGQVAFVAGEAGIGKSRLLLEFRRRLAERGEDATWLEGRCVSFGQTIPLLPLIDQLRENFRIEEFDGEPEIIAKIEHGMRRMGQLEEHIPYVRYLLSVDPGDPAIAAMDAAARRKRIFDAARALALRGTTFHPIVFVFEDLHWIDSSTEEYFDKLMDSVAGARMMVLLTYRFGYAPPFGTRSFHTTLTLDALGEAEAVEMAGGVLGEGQFPAELSAVLRDKAEGVPLFVEEVTKTLLDLGVLRRDNGGYRMVRTATEVGVPDTIQGIIMARLDRLGEDGKRTVQLASVIGRHFLRRLLERIGGLGGELDGLLRELKALEIIYEQGLLAEPAYIFKHAVIQDVAYQSLLVQRRKELHRAVGSAIEELYPDRLAEHYAELTHHFFQGEEWLKAMDYSVRAGDHAAHAFASAEARRHYARALEAAERAKPGPDPETVAGLHVKHGAILNVLAEYGGAVAEYERARALFRRAGRRREEVATLLGLSETYSWFHKPELVIQSVNEGLAIALEIGDRGAQAACLVMRGEGVAIVDGPVAAAVRDSAEAVRLARETPDTRLLARTLTYAGRHLEWHGDYERAIGYLREGAEVARREHAGTLMGLGLYHLGHAQLARGDYQEALRVYRDLGAYADAAGDKLYIARVPNLLGGVYLDLYDLDEAIRLNAEGDEVSRRLWPWPEPRGHSLWKLGLAHLYRGDHARAQTTFREAWDLLEVDTWGRWLWYISLLRSLGELALAEGRREEAWDYATQSLEMATRCGQQKHAARAQRLQGEVLAAQDRLGEAGRTLEASIALAERLGTPREVWLGRAALGRVLYRLGRDREAEASAGGALETLEAIADGLKTPSLRRSFLGAEPVLDLYRALGRRPPAS